MRNNHGANASNQPHAANACHAPASGSISATTRITATAWMARKANHATAGISSGRPEWPWVTRVTIAIITLPKKPTNSACAGPRPSHYTPVIA